MALSDQRQGQNVEAGRQGELRASVGGRQWGPEQRGGVEAQQLKGAIGPAADRLAIGADLQQFAVGLGHEPLPLSRDQPLGALGLAISHHDRLSDGGEQLGRSQLAQFLRRELGHLDVVLPDQTLAVFVEVEQLTQRQR